MQIDSKIQSLTHKSILPPAAKLNVLIAVMSKIHFFRNMEPRRTANSGLQTPWRRKRCAPPVRRLTIQQLTRRHVAAPLNNQLHIPFAVFREMAALYYKILTTTHKASDTATWVRHCYSKTRVIQMILNKFCAELPVVYCFYIVFLFFILSSCMLLHSLFITNSCTY